MITRWILVPLALLFFQVAEAQGAFVLQKGKSDRVDFEQINNLIIIPVEVNGVELSFLLDTGVSKPIIFNFLNLPEALEINQAERIFIRGLGEGESTEALKSRNNVFKIGNAVNISQDLYAIFDPAFNFAPRLGVPIHGIIGYDFLKDFVVEINYSRNYLKFTKHEAYEPKKCKNCETLNLHFFNNKPYIDGEVVIEDTAIPVTLLIDTGGSDALWLFESKNQNIKVPDKNFDDFLGRGLSGRVFGKRARLKSLAFKSFKLKEVNVAFPDSASITFARKFKDRSGSVAGNVLKRFNVIFDYANSKMVIKKNRYFSTPFYYNKSGIELEHDGVRLVREINKDFAPYSFESSNQSVASQRISVSGTYRYALAPSFKIVELRDDSPALKAGLKVGDVILSINGKHAHSMTMQQLIQYFYGEEGRRIRLLVDRQGVQLSYDFKLEELL